MGSKKKEKNDTSDSSSDESNESTKSLEDEVEEKEEEEKEQVYDELKSKIEILDILFHHSENNLINLGLINKGFTVQELLDKKVDRVFIQHG